MTDHDQYRDVHKDYIFLTLIGSGSFGKVHKVQNRQTQEIAACKEMSYASMSEKEKKLLVHEVNTLKDLHHRNIVRYIDRYLDRTQGKLYLVMQYCESGDLSRYIKRHKSERKYVQEEKIWAVLYQLLSALHYCHDTMLQEKGARIIHRDLKPGNVFMAKDGSLLLGDFGLCRDLDTDSIAKTNVGTPLYMPLEILNGQSYTEKADIYSLGCVMWELAALQPPYLANNIDSLKAKVRQGIRQPLPAHYSNELRMLLDKMLSQSPESRPSCAEMLQHPRIQSIFGTAQSAQEARQAPYAAPASAPVNQPNPFGAPVQSFGFEEQVDTKGAYLQAFEERLKTREGMLKLRDEKAERGLAEILRRDGRY